jgi:hydroxymethylglutaryl-CoA reductase
MLGCAGSHNNEPGANAKRLATIICATVLAGELSLLAAQCSDDLVRSHMSLNRSTLNMALQSSLNGKNGDPKNAAFQTNRINKPAHLPCTNIM